MRKDIFIFDIHTKSKICKAVKVYYYISSDMVKHELRVTSYELQVESLKARVESLKARVEIQKCDFE